MASGTEAVIRRAEDADLPAVAWLRRESAAEQDGDGADPSFEERFGAWYARESSRRIIWLAEVDGRPVGAMNLSVFERMPRPGRAPSRWGYLGNAFVLAAYRNQGIGGQLLDAVLGYARRERFRPRGAEPEREVDPVLRTRRVRAGRRPDALDAGRISRVARGRRLTRLERDT